ILDYVNVPVMVKFYPVKGFNIQVGPQVGFLLNAKNKYKENGTSVEDDYKDSLKKVDFGLAAGLGYKTGFGLNIDARYIHGLADINDLNVGDEIKNMVFQVSLGYSFLK
ncbi:MAG: porin family protein, partial [Cyclobacteriaceae bacterium]